MFNRILLALDGSPFAECAIEPALAIAKKFGSQVSLLRVLVVAGHPVLAAGEAALYPEPQSVVVEFDRAEAEAYLCAIQAQYASPGLNIQFQVVTGQPAAAIKATAAAQNFDLIVMSTHGRSGLLRLLYGSVAEAVLRGTRIPLLLIPVKGHPGAERIGD